MSGPLFWDQTIGLRYSIKTENEIFHEIAVNVQSVMYSSPLV